MPIYRKRETIYHIENACERKTAKRSDIYQKNLFARKNASVVLRAIEKRRGCKTIQFSVVRYIYEQYAIGVFVKDIIAALTAKGILYYGKPFVKNTVYKILKNERYSGIYRHNGEIFNNIYPVIVNEPFYCIVKL